MYKKYTILFNWPEGSIFKILLIMKLTVILCLVSLVHVSASSFAQHITLSKRQISLNQIFDEINKQTGYNFLWSAKKIDHKLLMDVNLNKTAINPALDQILKDLPLEYAINNRTIIIREKHVKMISVLESIQEVIQGKVLGQNGQPLAGVTVSVVGSNSKTGTDENGNFRLVISGGSKRLRFIYVGYIPQEITVTGSTVNVNLEIDNTELDQVVVTALGFKEVKDRQGSTSSTVKAEDMQRSGETGLSMQLQERLRGCKLIARLGIRVRELISKLGGRIPSRDPISL